MVIDLITASAHELKGAVSRVVEVEWAKFTLFFSSEIGPFFKKVPHLNEEAGYKREGNWLNFRDLLVLGKG